MTEAEVLLADVQTLRQQTRQARRAFEFPLFLFGVLILLAPLCYTPAERIVLEDGSFMYPSGPGPFPMFSDTFGIGNPDLVSWYWFLTIVAGSVVTAWWYRRRSLRTGVESDTKGYLLAAGAALTAFLIGVPLLESLVSRHGLYSEPAENLPILFGSAIASALVFFWCTRNNRAPVQRSAGVFIGTLLATLTFSSLGVYFYKGFGALLIIAAGLLALAWMERSALLGAIALLFTAASIPANHQMWYWDFPGQFGEWGWGYAAFDDTRLHALQEVLVPGVILLAGAVVAFVVNRWGAKR